MALDVKNRANQKGGTNDGLDVPLQADQSKNLLTVHGGTQYFEMARAGGIWNVMSAAAAPLVAVPSTTATLEIYNNTNSGMVMEVIELFLFHLLGTAAVHAPSIWAQVTAPKAAPSTASLSVNSQSGRGKYTETAATRVTCGAATTVIATGWRPVGGPNVPATSTATPMEAFSVRVDGQFIVPAGCSLALAAVDTLATASSIQLGAVWNERTSITVQS